MAAGRRVGRGDQEGGDGAAVAQCASSWPRRRTSSPSAVSCSVRIGGIATTLQCSRRWALRCQASQMGAEQQSVIVALHALFGASKSVPKVFPLTPCI